MRICHCKDWEPQTRIIDGALCIDQIHGYVNDTYREAKVFEFCPWCGSKLEEIEDPKEPDNFEDLDQGLNWEEEM
jgi:viroplasmin and RNaseH domain-containing protein